MANGPDFDVAAAHKYFATHCFNSAWDLIDKTNRTPEDDQLMVALTHASIYHWLNRPDCTNKNLSIGYWQASRIQSLLGHPAEAVRHAEECLRYSSDLEPFYVGYAYEALARAAALIGQNQQASEYRAQAEAQAARVENDNARAMLLKDLKGLK